MAVKRGVIGGPATCLLLAAAMPATGAHGEPPLLRAGPAATPVPAPDPTPGLPGAATERAARARANLVALLEGRLHTSELSPQELQDVLDLERMTRGDLPDNRSVRQQCVDEEVRRNGGRPTRLAWEVIRLKCR